MLFSNNMFISFYIVKHYNNEASHDRFAKKCN